MKSPNDMDMLVEYVLKRVKEEVENNTSDFTLVEKLSIDEMIAICSGMKINRKTEVIRETLLQGKQIYCLESGLEYLKYKNTANKMYLKQLENYTEKLRAFGIVILQERDDFARLQNIDFREKNQGVKRLIIAKEVEEMAENFVLKVESGTIITPSAQDILKEKNIKVDIG